MGNTRENPVHVLLDDSNSMRRHLLLGGIDTIKALEGYENFKRLKNLKKKKFLQLNEELKSINQAIEQLNSVIPQVKDRRIERQISKLEVIREVPLEKVNKKDKTSYLRREIRTMQEKLSKLNF